MKRRGNNEGSIRRKETGTWEARYTDPAGARKSISANTRAEVRAKLDDTLSKISAGEYSEPLALTVGEWMNTWLEVYHRPSCKRSTYGSAKGNIRLHIIPALGEKLIQKVKVEHLQAFVNSLTNKGLSPSTVRRVVATLKSAFRQAVENGILGPNPAERIKLPKMQQKEVEFFTQEEQKALLEALPDNDNARMIRFILATGLRISEAVGLRWEDIGEKSFTVNRATVIVRTFSETGKKTESHTDTPKTRLGHREIPVTPSISGLLSEQRSYVLSQRLKYGRVWAGGDLVFPCPNGGPKDAHNMRRVLANACDKAGIPRRGVHALRHTFATNAVQSGMDIRTLSELLGHSKLAFTLQTYVHTNIDIKYRAMVAMASQ